MDTLIVRETAPGAFEEVPFGTSFTGSDNALHGWQVAELWSDTELATIGVYRVAPVVVPAGQSLVSQSFVRDSGGHVAAVGTFTDLPAPPPVVLPIYAATQRRMKEEGGITFNGAPIATDRPSQAMITGAYNMASRDANWSTQWKVSDGVFITLTAPVVIALAVAVGQHVAACFAKEADVDAAITAATITTTAQIDAQFAALNTAY